MKVCGHPAQVLQSIAWQGGEVLQMCAMLPSWDIFALRVPWSSCSFASVEGLV